MAIELTPQRRSRVSFFTTITGIVAVFLVLVFVGSYFYFYITNKGLLDKINKIIEDSRQLDDTISSKEEELSVSQKRIGDFSSLILGHKNVGSMFNFIDKNTIPTVWFDKFGYDETEEGAFLLSGEVANFFLLEQQVVAFRNQDLVKNARLNKVEIDEETGQIKFTVRIVLSPDAFTFKEEVGPLLQVETPTQ
jgi:hypothetical protein